MSEFKLHCSWYLVIYIMIKKTIIAVMLLVLALPVRAQIAANSPEEGLFQGVRDGDLASVQASLDAGANIFAKDMYGNTAADLAADKGFFNITHYLLQFANRLRQRQAQKTVPLVPIALPQALETTSFAAVIPAPPTSPTVTPFIAPPLNLGTDEGPFARSAPVQASLPIIGPVPVFEQKLRSTPSAVIAPSTGTALTKSIAVVQPSSGPAVQGSADVAEARPSSEQKAAFIPAPPPTIIAMQSSKEDATVNTVGHVDKFINAVSGFFTPSKPKPTEAMQSSPEAEKKQVALTLMLSSLPSGLGGQAHEVSHKDLSEALGLPLGKTLPEQHPKKPDTCIMKQKAVAVCIEQTYWSKGVFSHFDKLKSSIYKRFNKGNRAVVGYRDGTAKFVQTIFAASDFKAVTDHLTKLYGDPDERAERIAAPLGKPREVNVVLSWHGYDEKAGRETVLQIINYDETRSHFVKMTEGAVILKYYDEPSAFSYVSPIELIRIP